MRNSESLIVKWNKVVARAWADESYKEKLLSFPEEVLKAEGIELPEGRAVKIVEQAENESVLVLPIESAGCNAPDAEERLSAMGGYADGASFFSLF